MARYSSDTPGMMGGSFRPGQGGGMRPAVMDSGMFMSRPAVEPQTQGQGGEPMIIGGRPQRIKQPPMPQGEQLNYTGGSQDFDENTGTYRSEGGQGTPPGMSYVPEDPYTQQRQQMQNPFMGGSGFGGMGGYNQQMQNPFMGGGGYGGFRQQQMNPFMGGGMGGYGQQQMNPFMGGGGYGGYGQQQMNPFMGGSGFGGGMGGYGQQMQNPFMGGGMGNYGQQMQQPMQLQRAMAPMPMQQQPMQQPAQQPQPMGYQGGAF